MKVWAVALSYCLAVDAYAKKWDVPSQALGRLEKRQDKTSCPSENPVSCSAVDSNLPDNFCCGSDDTCMSVDRSSSAICCPKGSSCDVIGLINCDTSLQDASKNKGPIFTTKTDDDLPRCGDKCCPFGYTCSENGDDSVCVLDKNNAGAPMTTKVTSTSKATITSTPTGQSSGIDSNNPPPTQETNFAVGVFFAGFFPGIVVGILGTLAWVILTKRNNKPADTRGLNIGGHAGAGGRPFISGPIPDARHSNQRTDFLGRTRSRARSMFSTHRHTRTADSVDFWSGGATSVSKIPIPPVHNNVPVNYINDMPNVPVTPDRRVARYPSNEDVSEKGFGYSAARAPDDDNDNNNARDSVAPTMPAVPLAAIPPLRGMNTQRRVSPEHGTALGRRDSGKGMNLGSPYKTPEKKPQVFNNITPSMHATYHDAAIASLVDQPHTPAQPELQTLTPARYDPNAVTKETRESPLEPSAAALTASSRLSNVQLSLPSQQPKTQTQAKKGGFQPPTIPSRPLARKTNLKPRPETQLSDFDFDEGLDHDRAYSPTSPSDQHLDNAFTPRSPPHKYESQAVSNPYTQPRSQAQRANPASTFDDMVPGNKRDKHATNATTFTTMLRNVGFPDPGDQLEGRRGVPAVPKLDAKKVREGKKSKGVKGMI